jgi:mannose/fructose/N-acetylgalactosamine-specific phosphotransferase system component IIC
MGAIGVSLALIYIALAPKFNVNANTAVAGGGSADELDDILNDF